MNRIGDAGATAVAMQLKNLRNLQDLDLSGCARARACARRSAHHA